MSVGERVPPTAITVVNRLDAPTSIHWHGLELESYYGVIGAGVGDQVTPAVAPGQSFVAGFTPTRAGTFGRGPCGPHFPPPPPRKMTHNSTWCRSWPMVLRRPMRFASWGTALLSAVISCAAQDGQVRVQPRTNPPAQLPADPALQTRSKPFVSEVELVLVPVTVSDMTSRLVTGLQPWHFNVFEDGQAQTIEYFYTQDTPISVGIIVDTSGSMGDTLRLSRYAVQEFMQASNPEDEFFLITFADKPSLDGDFTEQPEDIQGALLYTVSKGRTALWDAVYLGCRKMKAAKHPKRVLLVVSDGGENHSRYTYKEIQDIVRESDVQIYGVGIPGADYGPWGMAGLSNATGGRTFEGTPATFGDTFTKIAVELRNQYVLGYRPTNRKHDGKFRKIRVKLQPPRGLPPLQVSARKSGYYAPQDSSR